MATVPNFNYADRIQVFLDNEDPERHRELLEELRSFRAFHPRKFLAALRWAVGAKSDLYKRIDKQTKRGVEGPKFQGANFRLNVVPHGYEIDFEIVTGRGRKPRTLAGTVCRDFGGNDGQHVAMAIYDYFIEQRGVRPEELAEGARQRQKERAAGKE